MPNGHECPSNGCSTSPEPSAPSATAVYVAYAAPTLDLDWLPDDIPVVVVHNDGLLDTASVTRPHVRHLHSARNVGFGAAVNLALDLVATERIVLCNPDVTLDAEHWKALVHVDTDDVVTVPLSDGTGRPTSVVSSYPTPVAHLASGYRLGRFAPRGGSVRRTAMFALGSWGRAHQVSLAAPIGAWPLAQRWVSGGVLSMDVERLRAVGGFDPAFFLYYEDVDLCSRLAARFPSARAVVADVAPGTHLVGGSAARPGERRRVERQRRFSAAKYARRQPGAAWSACAWLLRSGNGDEA